MTSEPLDCYAVLGLLRDATQAQVSAAYRALLRRYHPDTRAPDNPVESDAALQRVIAAYAILRDPVRRFDYDQQTTQRIRASRAPARPTHVARGHPFEDPPLRAGPVHWTP